MATRQGRQVFEGSNLTRSGATIAPNASGEDFIVLMGDGDGSGNGGGLNLVGGSGGLTGDGGNMIIQSGDGGSASGSSGNIQLICGNSSGSFSGGNISLIGGTGGATGNGGNITITAGPGGSSSGNGGTVQILGGLPSNGSGGSIEIIGRSGAGVDQNGGSVYIRGGSNTGSGAPGSIQLETYNGQSVNLLSQTTTTVVPLRFFEAPVNGSNYISFQSPTNLSTNINYILPTSDGTNGQVLSTDGSGVLSWQDVGNFNSSNGESFETAVTFTTTDNTTQTAFSYTPGANRMTFMETFVTAKRVGIDNGAAYIRRARFRFDNSGTATIFGLSTEYTNEDVASWNHTLDANASSARVRVTGQTGATINWVIRIKIVTVVA